MPMKVYRPYTLEGIDGNAFAILGYVCRAMKQEGKTKEEVDTYNSNAMSGDYNNLKRVSMQMLDKLNDACNGED